MKKICECCIHNACAYKTRGLENKCEKVQDYEQGYEDAVENGNAWHDAESDDLPPYEKEVIVLCRRTEYFHEVCFAHRPDPNGCDCKSVLNGEIYHYNARTFGKGWNIDHVKWWLDIELPKVEEEEE